MPGLGAVFGLGLGAVGGPCFLWVAGDPPEDGLLLPLSVMESWEHSNYSATTHA